MDDKAALLIAIDLLHVPSRIRAARAAPLPDGIPLLLRLASDDRETLLRSSKATGRTPDFLRNAATFYIEQVLLDADSDSYRVLGLTPAATTAELRHNMALLLRWLHPDVAAESERSVFARRITDAWAELKTPERRADYDRRTASSGVPSRADTRRAFIPKRPPLVPLNHRVTQACALTRALRRLIGRQP